MNIVEIKIVKADTDSVVHHDFFVCEDGVEHVVALTTQVIERVTRSNLDNDDLADVIGFGHSRELATRFGADWEFFVEGIVLSFDECDIDDEFDNPHDKYHLCL